MKHQTTLLFTLSLASIFTSAESNFNYCAIARELIACCKLSGLAICGSCIYAMAQDTILAHICPEHFTTGMHKRNLLRMKYVPGKSTLLDPSHPSRIGLGWGLITGLHYGSLLSIPLIHALRAGASAKLTYKNLIRPLGTVLAGIGAVAALCGSIGYVLAKKNKLNKAFWQKHNQDLPDEKLNRSIACSFAHDAGTWAAKGATAGLCLWAIKTRCFA